MGVGKKKKTKLTSISRSRPPLLKPQSRSLSSKATRNVIRSHHSTLKAHAKALRDEDDVLAQELETQLTEEDLKAYQLASKTGQSAERGGDSSRLLVEWAQADIAHPSSYPPRLRILEVGALSTTNAISKVSGLDVTRIDLHSQEKGILQQDFMKRPLPTGDDEKFHMISLSLVLNFVGDAISRGEMLKRCTEFLRAPSEPKEDENQMTTRKIMLPALFMVLPGPCVTNSRYLNETRLSDVMGSLGFTLQRRKITSKLYYSLWKHNPLLQTRALFKKKEIESGRTRNNFSIILK